MSNSPKLSVIMPAFNETGNIKKGVLGQVDKYLKSQDYSYEVIIVDDGSTDETVNLIGSEIKNYKNFSLIKNPHAGKAITVMTGMLQSKGEIVVFTDLDQATPLDQIEKFFPKFSQGYDVVIGARSGRKGAPFIRKLSAWGFTVLRNIILGLPFSDTQCGFKAFNQKAVRLIFPSLLTIWKNRTTKNAAVNAGFDVEMLFMGRKKGLKITDVPVEWHYVGTERVPFFKSAIEAIHDMLRIRLNALQGRYK